MKRLALAVITALCVSGNAFALACVTAATGNWSNSATWSSCGGGVPGNNDTVTFGGAHTVTVDTNTTVGDSPAAGGIVVAVSGGGGLIVATGVTFTVRGGITLNNTPMTMNAGSTLEFDASAASSPSTARYVLQVSTANSQANAKFTATGTSGSRVTIRSNASGANARFTDGSFITGGRMEFDYVDFTRIGDSSNAAFIFWPSTSGHTWRMNQSTCTSCGQINQNVAANAGAVITITNNRWSSTASTNVTQNLVGNTGSPALTLTGNVFDKPVAGTNISGWTITGNFFTGTSSGPMSWTSGTPTLFSGNFLYNNCGTSCSFNTFGTMQNNYWVGGAGNTNAHGMSGTQAATLTGNLFESLSGSESGDCIVNFTPASTLTLTITDNIFLPNADGEASCTPSSQTGNSNARLVINKNTYIYGSTVGGGFRFAETHYGVLGLWTTIKSNLGWDTSARGYKASALGVSATGSAAADTFTVSGTTAAGIADGQTFSVRCSSYPGGISEGTIYTVAGTTATTFQPSGIDMTSNGSGCVVFKVDPAAAQADIDYNWTDGNFATGTYAPGGYYFITSYGAPGQNDITGAIGFADRLRNLRTRDAFCGGPGTAANFLTEVQKMNLGTFNTCYTIADVIAWVKAGYAPQNVRMATAGHDGGRVGAIAPRQLVTMAQ